MAYNVMSGTLVNLNPRKGFVTGTLGRTDGTHIKGVPRMTNATNNAVVTNVDGNENRFTCESNLGFNGSLLAVTGHLTASLGISGSYFMGDGSLLTNVSASTGGSGGGDTFTVNAIGDASANLVVGFNYLSAIMSTSRTWTTPAVISTGDVIRIKAGQGVSTTNALVIEGYADNTIDNANRISIESPYGAVSLCYVASGSYRIF